MITIGTGKREARLNRLLETLRIRKYLSVKEMAQILSVSEMTVRRDSKILEENHLVSNMNGVLVYNPGNTIFSQKKDYELDQESRVQNEAKTAIGRFAASLIEPDDFIILDTGTTTQQIIPYIRPEIKISMLCYNINILMQVYQRPNIKIDFAGGHYHPNAQMFESNEGIHFIQQIRANKAFISAAGVHKKLGITCVNSYEVPTKRAIIQSSVRHILVADSSKFGEVFSSYFCNLTDMDTIVTDTGLTSDWVSQIEKCGIQLYCV